MDTDALVHERQRAIHLLRAGRSVGEVAQALGRSERWVRKWRRRFREEEWEGLKSRSRRPKHLSRRLPEPVRQAIREARSELEAQASTGQGLKYIGSSAVRTRLKDNGISPLPSRRTIERVLQEAGMTRPRRDVQPATPLPRLQTIGPHTLVQIDIVPHFLQGGQAVACFNALEVGTRYPTGRAYAHRRAQEACEFAVHVWKTIGIPTYTQVDNEGCFSGGHTHPYVLGRLVRLALMVGTELVFSALREPESQGFIERFHQDYNSHVWQDTYLASLEEVNQRGDWFFQAYRRRPHPQMEGRTPQEVHQVEAEHRLPPDFFLPSGRIPLYAGRVHFIRRVQEDRTIRVLNVSWPVPKAEVGQGVWATLELCSGQKAWLRVYDGAPDAPQRKLLVAHPFPLREPVLSCPERRNETAANSSSQWRIGRLVHWGIATSRTLARVGTMSWRFLRC
ncbi:MAG: hypothetical protein D6694_09615 [Gammaproteobacteria bacterium]|nr:MAG: hypothetical protein D6694_09615 [Gammaproteobacteria bacterium]